MIEAYDRNPHIKHLDFTKSSKPIDLSIMEMFPSLRRLYLYGSQLINLSNLSRLKKLRILTINNVDAQQLSNILNECPKFKDLELSFRIRNIQQVTHLQRLKVLRLVSVFSCNSWNEAQPIPCLTFISQFPHLQRLCLSYNDLLQDVYPLVLCPNLKRLEIFEFVGSKVQNLHTLCASESLQKIMIHQEIINVLAQDPGWLLKSVKILRQLRNPDLQVVYKKQSKKNADSDSEEEIDDSESEDDSNNSEYDEEDEDEEDEDIEQEELEEVII